MDRKIPRPVGTPLKRGIFHFQGEVAMACPYRHFFYNLTILFFISFFLLLLQSQTSVALIGTDGKIKLKD